MKFVLIACLTGLVLLGGCLCCPVGGTESPEAEVEGGCSPPYIAYADGCCLDADGNSVCDRDETADTLSPPTLPEEPTTTAGPTTTVGEAVEATETTATTVKMGVKDCVSSAGYNPDEIIFIYSNNCGSKFVSTASNIESRKGVGIQKLDIGVLTEKEKTVLACFYGPYSETNKQYRMCPRLLCPATGGAEDIDGRRPVDSQMSGFVLRCTGA